MIYVECKPDEALVRLTAGITRKEIVHELKGKYEVLKRLDAGSNYVALLDEDPRSIQPSSLKRMVVQQEPPNTQLKVLYDSRRNNRIILLYPRLEEWVITAAEETRIDMDAYGLPSRGQALHKIINDDLRKFERLLSALRGSQRLTALGQLLRQ